MNCVAHTVTDACALESTLPYGVRYMIEREHMYEQLTS